MGRLVQSIIWILIKKHMLELESVRHAGPISCTPFLRGDPRSLISRTCPELKSVPRRDLLSFSGKLAPGPMLSQVRRLDRREISAPCRFFCMLCWLLGNLFSRLFGMLTEVFRLPQNVKRLRVARKSPTMPPHLPDASTSSNTDQHSSFWDI